MPRIPARNQRSRSDWAAIANINKAGRKRKASGLSFFKRHAKVLVSQGKDSDFKPSDFGLKPTKRPHTVSDDGGSAFQDDLNFIYSKFRKQIHQLSPRSSEDEDSLQEIIDLVSPAQEDLFLDGVDPLFSDYSDSDERIHLFEEFNWPGMDVDIEETDGREKRDVPAMGKEGGQGSGGSSGQQTIRMFKSLGAIHDGNTIFIHHCHKFYLWGCSWNTFDVKIKNQTTSPGYRRVTSAGQFARNELLYYMSPAEYKNLPPNCTVEMIGLKITPVATEASFATGQTITGFASLKHAEFGIVNKGMNEHLMVEPVAPTIDQTMKITEIDNEKSLSDIMWGKANQSDYPSCTLLGRNFPNYDSIILPKKDFKTTNNIWSSDVEYGTVDYSTQYSTFNVNEAVTLGQQFTWVYKPKLGTIKTTHKAHGVMTKGDQFIIGSEYLPMGVQKVKDQDTVERENWPYGPLSTKDNSEYLSSVVEHGFWSGQLNRHNSCPFVPSFSFGMMPIPTNVPNEPNNYVNSKMTVMLETFIRIVPSTFSFTTIEPTQSASSEIFHYLPMKAGLSSFLYDSNAFIQSVESVKNAPAQIISGSEFEDKHVVPYEVLNENYNKLYNENQFIKQHSDAQIKQLEQRITNLQADLKRKTEALDKQRKPRSEKEEKQV